MARGCLADAPNHRQALHLYVTVFTRDLDLQQGQWDAVMIAGVKKKKKEKMQLWGSAGCPQCLVKFLMKWKNGDHIFNEEVGCEEGHGGKRLVKNEPLKSSVRVNILRLKLCGSTF